MFPSLSDKPRPQTVSPKVPRQPRQAGPALHDRGHRAREQGRAGPTHPFHMRRKIAPSLIPVAASQAASASVLRPKMGLSGAESAFTPAGWVFEYSSRYMWKNLGTRLQQERPDLKDAPAVLAELAGQWWALALQHAREAALEDLAEARRELSAERDEHHRQQAEVENQASEMRSLSEAADLSEKLATARATEARKHAGIEADLRHAVERAQAAASAATAEADNQRGRSAALVEQLARLQSLPAEFEAALRRNQRARKSPNKASKRAKKATPKAP